MTEHDKRGENKISLIALPVRYDELDFSERRKVREEYVKVQEGRCMYCNGDLSLEPPSSIKQKKINWRLFPSNFLKYPVHLQHCHKSGLTEGAVHAYCNAVLWQYHGK